MISLSHFCEVTSFNRTYPKTIILILHFKFNDDVTTKESDCMGIRDLDDLKKFRFVFKVQKRLQSSKITL